MRWVTVRLHRGSGQRGAVAILVAVLISTMLVSLAAFVTDVGSWYAERAQLQNGADAAALAVAQTCARGTCDPSTAAGHPASRYANVNANDSLTTVDYVCGNGPGLTPCSASSCSSGSGNYVTVHTLTLESGGSHLLPPMFGKALLGGSYNGQTIDACGRASWLNVGGGFGLALTVSLCAWNAATAVGTHFAPPPPYASWPPAGVAGYTAIPPAAGTAGGEQVLAFHGSGNDCAGNWGSGWSLPGGFGYLAEGGTAASCTISVSIDGTYSEAPGNSVTAECANAMATSATNHSIVYIPVYNGLQGTGENGIYHLAGFAAFVLTGGWLTGNTGGFKHASTITGRNYCQGDQRCIYGFFTQGLVPRATSASSGGLPGVYTTKLTA